MVMPLLHLLLPANFLLDLLNLLLALLLVFRLKHLQLIVDHTVKLITDSTIGRDEIDGFIFQNSSFDTAFSKVVHQVQEFIDTELKHIKVPIDKTVRGKGQVLYFGKRWSHGSKKVSDAQGNKRFPELYDKLRKLPIWEYTDKFLKEHLPLQYKLLEQLPSEYWIFGKYPYLIINVNHLSIKHRDSKDCSHINCLVVPFGTWTSGGDIVLEGYYDGAYCYQFNARCGSITCFNSCRVQHKNVGDIIGGCRNSFVLTIHNYVLNSVIKESNLDLLSENEVECDSEDSTEGSEL